jgi:ribosomal protein S18 acetylase RimI-like enzyme
MGGVSELLSRLENYYDTVPRASSTVEELGPFTLFVGTEGASFYARPTLGHQGPISVDDVNEVLQRQVELGVPRALEWVEGTTPSLADAAIAAGLEVHRHPLMVLDNDGPSHRPEVDGVAVRMATPDDEVLPALWAVLHVGFSSPGTAAGEAGAVERDAALTPDDPAVPPLRARISSGLTAVAVAEDERGPVAGGSHSPRNGVSELMGIATLPAYRRRGIGAMVTARLVAHAGEVGVDLCFLSASGDEVARMYEGVGFTRVGTACIAEPDQFPPG